MGNERKLSTTAAITMHMTARDFDEVGADEVQFDPTEDFVQELLAPPALIEGQTAQDLWGKLYFAATGITQAGRDWLQANPGSIQQPR